MLPEQHVRATCHHCGRGVARDRRKSLGKGMVPHKCRHGRWCDAGNRFTCGNNTPGCLQCADDRHQERQGKAAAR